MKKASPMTRIIDIFSTESIETCEQLLDAAKSILKNRRPKTTRAPRRAQPKVRGMEQVNG